jgi:hypothetical protein
VVGKMEPIHVVIVILGIALLYFGHGRLKVMAEALSRAPALGPITEEAEDAHHA